jgi:hypothetical protein
LLENPEDMDIYRKGITGKMAEFAVKNYKSHHCIPDLIYNEIKFIFYVI